MGRCAGGDASLGVLAFLSSCFVAPNKVPLCACTSPLVLRRCGTPMAAAALLLLRRRS